MIIVATDKVYNLFDRQKLDAHEFIAMKYKHYKKSQFTFAFNKLYDKSFKTLNNTLTENRTLIFQK